MLQHYIESSSEKQDNGCWNWLKAKDKDGYGCAKHSGKFYRAHRLSYLAFNNLTNEDIKGATICHRCDNPSCVNPDHLFIGTHTDNMRDKVSKGRSYSSNKLTEEQVTEIREKYGEALLEKTRLGKKGGSISYKLVAELYGVAPSNIKWIITNKTHRKGLEV